MRLLKEEMGRENEETGSFVYTPRIDDVAKTATILETSTRESLVVRKAYAAPNLVHSHRRHDHDLKLRLHMLAEE